ncbi:MAG: hypothetical protein WC792_02815 [Candidatus Micrarchaeia archaeon]|jgi:DNA-directed RNA polymerase subunit RPC12/RpoP
MAELDFAGLAYHAAFVIGSASFGYLLLRLTWPDVRLGSAQEKLGFSAIAGGAIAIAAIFLDYFASGFAGYDFSQGFAPAILAMLLVLCFAGFQAYFYYSRPAFLTVGIPIPAVPLPARVSEQATGATAAKRVEQAPAIVQAAAPKAPQVKEAALGVAARLADALKAEVKPQMPIPQFFAKAAEKPAEAAKPKETVPIAKPVEAPMPKEAQPAKKEEPAAQAPKPFQAPPWIAAAKKPAISAIPPVPIKQKPQAVPAAPMQPAAVQPQPQPAPTQAQPQVQQKMEFEIPLKQSAQPAKPPLPAAPEMPPKPVPAIAPQAPTAWPPAEKRPLSPNVAEIYLTRKEVAPAEKMKELKKEISREEQSLEIDVPLKKGTAGTLASAPISQVAASKEEVKAELRKVREAEAEAVLTDIMGGPLPEGEGGPAAKQQPSGERVRRRYLEAAQGAQSVRVIASRNVAAKEEFNDLVQDVYTQLKATKTEDSLKSTMQVGKPEAKATPAAPAKVTMEDLFGEQKGSAVKTGGESSALFDQLNAISAGRPQAPAEEKKASVEFVKIQAEKGMGCPTCHSKNTRIVFCPYCGTGLCANCSPKITPKADYFVYVCPKCLEDVTVKKKTPTNPAAPQAVQA